jgi:hypothetical protein
MPIRQKDRRSIPLWAPAVRYSCCQYSRFGRRNGSVRFTAIGVSSLIAEFPFDRVGPEEECSVSVMISLTSGL